MSRLHQWSRKKRGVNSEDDAEHGATAYRPHEVVATGSPGKEVRHEDAGFDCVGFDDVSHDVEVDVEKGTEHSRQAAIQHAQQSQEDQQPAPGSLDHTLPDPDTLLPGSDFSVFMASGVSASLRRRALKRLWATGNYNVRDGLDDYDADYRQQLKPMSSELAGKLRQWANTLEEGREQPVESDIPEEPNNRELSGEENCLSENSKSREDRPQEKRHEQGQGTSRGAGESI